MLDEMLEQPAVFERILHDGLPGVCREIASRRPRHVVLTGSGDSCCAAQAGAWCFRGLAGEGALARSDVHAVHPLDLGRYRHDLLGPDTWVVAISASGRTRRVLEAVQVARAAGARVVAITDDPEGPLACDAADCLLLHASPAEALQNTDYDDPEARAYVGYHHDVPQTKTYTASLLRIFQLAQAWAGLDDTGQPGILHALPEAVARTLVDIAPKAREAARHLVTATSVVFLGSGAAFPHAQYGAFKMVEFARQGLWQEMEEYCHTVYFVTHEKTAVVFLAHDRLSQERAEEVAPVLTRHLGARCILVTLDRREKGNPRDSAFASVVKVPSAPEDAVHAAFRPLLLSLVIQRLVHAFARRAGLSTSTFRGGQDAERYVAGSLTTIRASRMVTPVELGIRNRAGRGSRYPQSP
jgi:fructoselysine-6-P-deglycase FrlB-like protein